jgi:hypothetical protein
MGNSESRPAAVKLVVTNRRSARTTIVLEPAGEVYQLDPGESRVVVYDGDPEPRLSVDLGEGETKIWEEGPGRLALE